MAVKPKVPKGVPYPDELSKIDYKPPQKGWMDTLVEFKPGTYCYGATIKNIKALESPNQREWSSKDKDWKLPENWREIFLEGMEDRLRKYRSFRLFMDICVRCGACADKCHFFIGSGDPKNMPILRAELLRSVYRKYFTAGGKYLGRIAGARELTYDVLKELWYYAYQCTECRRCSAFCPYGIDTAEVTIIVRELLYNLGLITDWIAGPVVNCYRSGNHLGILPHTLKDTLDTFAADIKTITGIKVEPTINRKGAEILFVGPSGDFFADPGTFTCMGELMIFHELGLDYTWSSLASEGGNFGFFTSNEWAKRLHYKIYAEAKRLKVKWILGGECGHMWRLINQYLDTWWGPTDFLEEPVSPITGTKFENAKSTKMVHICEFTADLIRHGKLKLDPSRNDHLKVTFHDSCNTSRAMGFLEEPRYIIKNVCNNFYEMPPNTIREQTFCCGSGSGLNAGENMELRMRGGFPRANAVRYVHEKYGVNMLANICAIDRAALPALMDYWVPGVGVTGTHEMVANALVMKGEKERTIDMRGEPLLGKEAKGDV
ncbi:MAG: (Fe-S)-binding protein [Nitrospirae bacterium]|nr:(Fe-S)-binding protein [Nitrospirota bacterium]